MTPFDLQELRGAWLGLPEAYHPFDFLGVALGGYFLVTHPSAFGKALGLLMIGIHINRFFFAPQDMTGLERLAQALDVSPEALHALAERL